MSRTDQSAMIGLFWYTPRMRGIQGVCFEGVFLPLRIALFQCNLDTLRCKLRAVQDTFLTVIEADLSE